MSTNEMMLFNMKDGFAGAICLSLSCDPAAVLCLLQSHLFHRC
jgi:hypothetical protein